MKTWILSGAGALLLAIVWAGARVLRGRRADPGARRLSRLVLDVFGDDWARRLGRPSEELRSAVLSATEPVLARELDALVRTVDVSFNRGDPAADVVGASMTVAYADDGATATARLRLPWDATPADVRAEFLREGVATASRRWTVPTP